jgi:tetratricopeptide (TPR) repeat protein
MKKNKMEKLRRRSVSICRRPGEKALRVTYGEAIDDAQKLLNVGNHQAAAYRLQQLAGKFKKESQPLLRLLVAYMNYRRFDEAIPVADKLLECFPNDAAVLIQVAMLHHLIEQPEKALLLAERASKLRPRNTQAIEMIAIIYQSLGDEEKVAHFYDKAVRFEPQNPGLLFGKSRVVKSTASAGFVRHLESIKKKQKLTDQERAMVCFSLAWVYEKTDCDAHFRNLEEANALVYSTSLGGVEAMEGVLKKNRAIFSQGNYERFGKHGNAEYSPIFIASLPRSGTTLLETMLGAHSRMKRVGESGAMENALNLTKFPVTPFAEGITSFDSIRDYGGAIARVQNHYMESRVICDASDRVIIDKSISNYYLVGLILMVFPNAKIIDLKRHPLDIVYSCYQQYFSIGHHYAYSLESLANLYKIYSSHMVLWKEKFGENIYTVYYEDLVLNQEQTLRSALKFCGLPWEEQCKNYHATVGTVTTSSDQQVRQPLYQTSVNKWMRVRNHLDPALKILGDLVEYRIS